MIVTFGLTIIFRIGNDRENVAKEGIQVDTLFFIGQALANLASKRYMYPNLEQKIQFLGIDLLPNICYDIWVLRIFSEFVLRFTHYFLETIQSWYIPFLIVSSCLLIMCAPTRHLVPQATVVNL